MMKATEAVAQRLGGLKPRVAIVLGSGLGFLADEVVNPVRIPYKTIPGFPEPGVAGHKGELVVGTLEGVPVIVQAGRFISMRGIPRGAGLHDDGDALERSTTSSRLVPRDSRLGKTRDGLVWNADRIDNFIGEKPQP